jgi:CheY-like chemotaxis protein
MAVMATRGLDEQERQRAGLVTKYTLSEIRKKHSRLLLVEDSAVNREIMLHMLSKLGYTTDVAETGRAAVEAVQRESYGLILMDLHLPDISGVKAIESIRALPGAHAKTSIVVLTAGATDAERERCHVLDVKDFLTKPVDPGVLGDVLKRWCILHSPSSGPANTAPETSEDTAGKDDVSPDPKLVEIFIKEATQRLASLRQAFATSDAQRAAREAHTLKSSSAYFQAHAMHEAAEQLEKMADSGQLGKAESVLQALEGAYAALRSRLERDTI